MKRFLILLLTLCIAVTCFSACGKRADNSGELVIYAGEQWVGTDGNNLNTFEKKFNDMFAKELGFEVDFQSRQQITTDLSNMLTSGQGGDLFILDRYSIQSYAIDDALSDWEKYLERDEIDLTKIDAASLSESMYEGKQYALPMDIDVWGLYVNQDMVDAYNATQIDESKKITSFDTWEDIIKAAKALVKIQDGAMSVAGYATADIAQRYYSFMSSASSELFNEEGFVDIVGNQGFEDMLSFFRRVQAAGIGQAGLEGQTNFAIKKLAICHGSSYMKRYLESMNVDFNYKVYPQPRRSESDENAGLLGGYSFALPARSRKISQADYDAKCERAWKFVKTMLSNEEIALEWMKICGSYSPLTSVWENDFVKNDKYFASIKNYIELAKARPAYSYFPVIQASYIVEDMNTFLNGNDGVKTTVENMQSRANTAITAFKNMLG